LGSARLLSCAVGRMDGRTDGHGPTLNAVIH